MKVSKRKLENALLVARMVLEGRPVSPYAKVTILSKAVRCYTPSKEGIFMVEEGEVKIEDPIFKKTIQIAVGDSGERKILVSTNLKNPVVSLVLPLKGPRPDLFNYPTFGANCYGFDYRPGDRKAANRYLYAAEHILVKSLYKGSAKPKAKTPKVTVVKNPDGSTTIHIPAA